MSDFHLAYRIMGQGDRVVVFESGLGGYYYDWNSVINAMKDEAVFITYHRAGYGRSTSTGADRTTGQIAYELNELLNELEVNKAIILVGHSFGGLCVQHFARLYPKKVKGVVLVDSTSPDFNSLYSLDLPFLFSHIAIEKLAEKWEQLSNKNTEELSKLINPALSEEELRLTIEEQEAIIDFGTNPGTYSTMSSEVRNWEKSSKQIKSGPDFPDVPLYVIARDRDVSVKFYVDHGIPETEAIQYEDTWRRLQLELSLLSDKGKFITADGSDHVIQLEKPEVVVECIRKLLQT